MPLLLLALAIATIMSSAGLYFTKIQVGMNQSMNPILASTDICAADKKKEKKRKRKMEFIHVIGGSLFVVLHYLCTN